MFGQLQAATDRSMLREGNEYVSTTEKIVGRAAMMIFATAFMLEFASGESFPQQVQDGMSGIADNAVVAGSAVLSGVTLTLSSLRDRVN
jgi:hypothetical protein